MPSSPGNRRTDLYALKQVYNSVRFGTLPPLTSEIELQAAVVAWCHCRCPLTKARYIYAMAHEGDLTKAARYRTSMQGVRSGQSDLILPVPSGLYGALYIELKWEMGDLTDNQFLFLQEMEDAGNAVTVEWSFHTCCQRILEYLREPEYFVGGP